MDAPLPTLEVLELDAPSGGARGRVHGEQWRDAIAELAETRLQLCVEHGTYGGPDDVLAVARAHLPVLSAHAPDLAAELEGIAAGADVSAERIVVLNHYTDLRDPAASDDGGCTAVYANGDDGPVLGQTWDMQASSQPYVRLLKIRGRGDEPDCAVLTLTGCVGMAGMASTGVAVTINNLRSTDRGIGVVWPALVRAMLRQPTAVAARDLLMTMPLTSGHHYMIADGTDFFGVETSGRLKIQTQRGARAAHLHTNHCFDPVLRKHEAIPADSTTFARLNLATTVYAQMRPRDTDGVWDLLHTHDDGPGTLCIHGPRPDRTDDPDPTVTCAVMLMRLRDRRLRAVAGCDRRSTPVELALDGWSDGAD